MFGKRPRVAESSPVVSVAWKEKSRGVKRGMTRRIQNTDMCVEGTVEGVKIGWLVDTGSSIMILSLREYGKIPRSRRPALEPCTRKLYQADGGLMRAEGQAAMAIGVGRFSVWHTVVVVDCSDEGILGVDVCLVEVSVKDLAARTVSLEGSEVLLELRHSGGCHQVRLAEGDQCSKRDSASRSYEDVYLYKGTHATVASPV